MKTLEPKKMTVIVDGKEFVIELSAFIEEEANIDGNVFNVAHVDWRVLETNKELFFYTYEPNYKVAINEAMYRIYCQLGWEDELDESL